MRGLCAGLILFYGFHVFHGFHVFDLAIKISFSHKPMILQHLAKFKQKMAKKSKTIAENSVFWHKKGPGPSPKNHKNQKSHFFTKTHGFTTFGQI